MPKNQPIKLSSATTSSHAPQRKIIKKSKKRKHSHNISEIKQCGDKNNLKKFALETSIKSPEKSVFHINSNTEMQEFQSLNPSISYNNTFSENLRFNLFIAKHAMFNGYGVFSGEDIPYQENNLICIYYGDKKKIKPKNLDYTWNIYDGSNKVIGYLDSIKYRNVAAYINGGQYANLKPRQIVVNNEEIVGYFQKRNIKKNEELLIDYGLVYYDDRKSSQDIFYLPPSENYISAEDSYIANQKFYNKKIVLSKHLQHVIASTHHNVLMVTELFDAVMNEDVKLVGSVLSNQASQVDLPALSFDVKNNKIFSYADKKQALLTPLMLACIMFMKNPKTYLAIIQLLLKYNANPGRTTLIAGNNAIILLLSHTSAEEELTEENNYSCFENAWKQLVDAISDDSDLYIVNNQELSVFHYALKLNLLELTVKLIRIARVNEYYLFEKMCTKSVSASPHESIDNIVAKGNIRLIKLIIDEVYKDKYNVFHTDELLLDLSTSVKSRITDLMQLSQKDKNMLRGILSHTRIKKLFNDSDVMKLLSDDDDSVLSPQKVTTKLKTNLFQPAAKKLNSNNIVPPVNSL